MKKYQKGSSPILVGVVIVLVILVASAASYYLLKSFGQAPTQSLVPVSQTTPVPVDTSSGISDSDDGATLESEIEDTSIDSVDSELNDLDASAASL